MALLKAEADKLVNNQMVSGLIDELIEKDDMFSILPFVQVNSKAYVYHREDATSAQNNITLGAGLPAWVDPGTDTITEGAVPFVEIITKLRILAGDVDVDKFMQETESAQNDQLSIQIAKKVKAVGRQYHQAVAFGDSTVNTKQFDGMKVLNAGNAAQTMLAAPTAGNVGVPLTLQMLDQLLDMVPNGADAIVMRRGTIRAFRQCLRAAGGTSANEYMMEAFGRPMLTHNGVPIIINDFLPGNEQVGTSPLTNCSVYAARFNEADGLHGLYGGADAGIRIEEIGTVQNKDATRTRVKWYCGLALKSSQSLARLSGISNI